MTDESKETIIEVVRPAPPLKSVLIDPATEVVVPKELLAALMSQKKDLMGLFECTTTFMLVLAELLGGKIPRTPMEAMKAAPAILKALKSDKGLIDKLGPLLATIQEKAPQFMTPQMQAEFAAKFPQTK